MTTTETPRVARARARAAVAASKKTGDILPRSTYKLAGVPPARNATDRIQRKAANR